MAGLEGDPRQNDYVFRAGNRIGVVLVGSYRSYSAVRLSSLPTITVDTKASRIELPVVGGHKAALRAGSRWSRADREAARTLVDLLDERADGVAHGELVQQREPGGPLGVVVAQRGQDALVLRL